jgi:integrase
LLNDFADAVRDKPPAELDLSDYEGFLDRWTDSAPSTLASGVSLVRSFSRFVHDRGWAAEDVARPLQRPRRKRAEDLEVVTVSAEDVTAMLDACEDWQELLCITTAVYLGARRAALARIRRRDLDLVHGTLRLVEKGAKVSVKPLADEYLAILRAAEGDGLWNTASDYLIPNRRPASVRRAERSDKIVWETVKRVAARAGVRAHVHALRAAFAVQFDEAHPDQLVALKELLGHNRIETTMVYLRRKDKARAMESVRDLSWAFSKTVSEDAGHLLPAERGSGFSSQPQEAHTGFEPVPPP